MHSSTTVSYLTVKPIVDFNTGRKRITPTFRKYFYKVCRYLELVVVRGNTEGTQIGVGVFPLQLNLLRK